MVKSNMYLLLRVYFRSISGSSHIRSVLIGVEYQNYCQTLDVYLLFAIWIGQIQLKLIYLFVTQGRHGKFEPGKVQYSTPNFFDRLFLTIRPY